MAKGQKAKRGGGARRAAASSRSGRIRVRGEVSERRATVPATPEAREVRERIDAAIAQGEELRRGILERMNRAADLPASAVGHGVSRRGRE